MAALFDMSHLHQDSLAALGFAAFADRETLLYHNSYILRERP